MRWKIFHLKRCAPPFLLIVRQLAMVHIILYDKILHMFGSNFNQILLRSVPLLGNLQPDHPDYLSAQTTLCAPYGVTESVVELTCGAKMAAAVYFVALCNLHTACANSYAEGFD